LSKSSASLIMVFKASEKSSERRGQPPCIYGC
jgi:hypothetical protein